MIVELISEKKKHFRDLEPQSACGRLSALYFPAKMQGSRGFSLKLICQGEKTP